jgi:hypothetical protein
VLDSVLDPTAIDDAIAGHRQSFFSPLQSNKNGLATSRQDSERAHFLPVKR